MDFGTKKPRKPRIIEIDKGREDRDTVTKLLLTGLGYTIIERQLPLGDFQWDSKLGRVVVERKTPADASDVGRLRSQLLRLRDASTNGCFAIILIDWAENRDSIWEDSGFDNVLLSCQGRIRVAHCVRGELAHRLHSIYVWSQKAKHILLDTEV